MIAHDAGLKGGVGKGPTAATVPQLGQQGQEYKGELSTELKGELNQELKFLVGNKYVDRVHRVRGSSYSQVHFSPAYPCNDVGFRNFKILLSVRLCWAVASIGLGVLLIDEETLTL